MGNSYTRQSAADIVDDNTIFAAPLNAEFNALQNFADGSTGHSHDGTVGEGPKINLTTSVTGVLPVANGGVAGINKTDATGAPTTGDDANDGYVVGSIWVDVTNDLFYVCLDATVGAAIWRRFQPYHAALASISGLTTAADTMIYTTASNAYATTALTPFARTVLDDADASTALSTLGVSTFVKTILDDADAAAVRSTLGLSSAATVSLPLSLANGGTGSTDAAGARTALGLAIGTNVQAYDVELAALASVTSANDKLPYFNGSGTATTTDLSAAGRALIDDADATAQRTTLGLGSMALQSSSNVTITGGSVTGITDVAIADGGTGSSSAGGARTNLDVYSKGETDTAISSAVGAITGVPSGAVMAFAMASAPTGWMECNGNAISRSTYAALYTAIGTTYGTGDGSSTFNLPDFRGAFLRHYDHGRGTADSGRSFGSSQTSQNLAHNHTGTTSTDGAHTHTIPVQSSGGGPSTIQMSAAAQNATVTSSSAGSHNHTLNINNDGGTEARPFNYAIMYAIKT